MLYLQSCPKCKGKLYIDSDYNGWYAQCLMCGYSHDLEELPVSQDKTFNIEMKLSQKELSDFLPDSRSKYG